MNRFLSYISIFGAILVFSCNKLDNQLQEGHPVYLQVCSENAASDGVKSPYTVTVPSVENPLSAKVLVSTVKNEYSNTAGNPTPDDGQTGPVAIHTNATFTGAEKQLLNGVLYNSDPAKQPVVYFSALHPQENWHVTGSSGSKNFKAEYTFSGKEDVMFAPVTTGSYNSTPLPQLVFGHLLTYIKLYIYAESEEVSKAWGEITSIKIRNAHDMGHGSNVATVDLSSEPQTVSFTPVENYEASLFYAGSDKDFPGTGGYELPYSNAAPAKEVAYVLMAPVTAKATDDHDSSLMIDEFEIVIVSRNRQTTLNVDLMKSASEHFEGSTMGKQFSFTLKFTMGNTVAVQANVTEWETGGLAIGDVME